MSKYKFEVSGNDDGDRLRAVPGFNPLTLLTMTETELLMLAAQKWEVVEQYHRDGGKDTVGNSWTNCPLCVAHPGCSMCSIKNDSGYVCEGTPFEEYETLQGYPGLLLNAAIREKEYLQDLANRLSDNPKKENGEQFEAVD